MKPAFFGMGYYKGDYIGARQIAFLTLSKPASPSTKIPLPQAQR